METKLLESGTEAFEWWSFRLSVKWACKAEKGRGKWNRWLQNYERPLWFPLNFISPFFLATLPSNPLILSHHVLSSLCFGFLYQILSQFDFLLTPYVGLQAGSIPFTSSLHLRHMKPPPPSWVSHCSFMYFALSLLYFPFSLRPLNSSWERRCLTADSLTQIRVDILQRCFLQLTFFVSISDNDCNLHSIRWIPNQISIATPLCSVSCIQNDGWIAWFWPIVVSKRHWLHVL